MFFLIGFSLSLSLFVCSLVSARNLKKKMSRDHARIERALYVEPRWFHASRNESNREPSHGFRHETEKLHRLFLRFPMHSIRF